MLLRQNDEGRIYGITFVDNQHKVVFNGSDLGKGYGAKAILERLNAGGGSGTGGAATTGNQEEFEISGSIGIEQVVTDLTEAKQFDYSLPEALKRKRKKKKRKGHSQ